MYGILTLDHDRRLESSLSSRSPLMGIFVAGSFLAALWILRFINDPAGATVDFKWVALFIIWSYRIILYQILTQKFQNVLGHWELYWSFFLPLIFTDLLIRAVYFTHEWYQGRWQRKAQSPKVEQDDQPQSPNPLKPLIFPCRTAHTRLFPKKHSFSYSYLFVGIPVGWRGSNGSFLSADRASLPSNDGRPWKGWLSVESADYLNRGDDACGLQGKLDSYLRSQVCQSF